MTLNEYNQRIEQIRLLSQIISERISGMARLGIAHTDNPTFVELINQFDTLLKKAEKITNEISEELGLH